MKSSINDRYNVYAPKAERNSAPHLKRAKRTVNPLGSNFKVLQLQLSRAAVPPPPARTFCMSLSLLQTFVLFDRKCPAKKWTSQDIPPSFQFEASIYVPFKGH